MKNKLKNPISFYRYVLFSLFVLTSLACYQISQVANERKLLVTSTNWNYFIIVLLGMSFFFLVLWLVSFKTKLTKLTVATIQKKSLLLNQWICLLIIVIIVTFYVTFFIVNNTYSEFFNDFFPRLLFLWFCSLLILYFLENYLAKLKIIIHPIILLALILLCLVFFEEIAIGLTKVTNNPFSLSWSETSHLYYSSTVFAWKIYDTSVPMYSFDQTRYLLQCLPFIFSGLPIWIHRFWQFLLTVGFPILFMFFLSKRIQIENGLKRQFFLVWGYVWLSQIYIYYHLIACMLMIVIFYSNKQWKRNILVVCIASVWAGFSRVNWIPAPGLLASLFYLLESKYEPKSGLIEYIKKPFLYFAIGMVTGLSAQYVYILISGYQDSAPFMTVFRSFMLWYRLLPNASFIPGILPGILIISGFLIIYAIRKFFLNPEINALRRIGVLFIVFVFFIGGLVVSVKIGGGNNLHNLDVFALFLLIIVSYIFMGKISPDKKLEKIHHDLSQWLWIGIVIIPILWSLFFSDQPYISSKNGVDPDSAIKIINETIDTYAKNRKVLFISQRHLLAFRYIQDVPVIPDFEQEILIDMAMSGDRQRLQSFYQKLRNYEYEIIVVNPLNTNIVGLDSFLAEENNLWVQGVSKLILNRYQPIVSFPEYGLEMLIPKIANQSSN